MHDLIEQSWCLYLLMCHLAVPHFGKLKSVVAIQGSRAQRRILARSSVARYNAPSLKERGAVELQATWDKIHQQWLALWMDNWYNKQVTTNPEKNNKPLTQQHRLCCSCCCKMGRPSSAAAVFRELRPVLWSPQQPQLPPKAAKTPVHVDQK